MSRRRFYADRRVTLSSRSDHIVTLVAVEQVDGCDVVEVWSRGQRSGVLAVNQGDGEAIARRLLGPGFIEDTHPTHGGSDAEE